MYNWSAGGKKTSASVYFCWTPRAYYSLFLQTDECVMSKGIYCKHVQG